MPKINREPRTEALTFKCTKTEKEKLLGLVNALDISLSKCIHSIIFEKGFYDANKSHLQ